MFPSKQKTLLKPVEIKGIGLHSGLMANVTIKPSLVDTGITFVRKDQNISKNTIKANFKNVTSAKLCTVIKNSLGVSVSTIEHLMGALYGEGIDNAIIEVDNVEIPILDGSAAEFVRLIRSAGIKEQEKQTRFVKVLKKIRIDEGAKYISIEPSINDFKIDFKIVYENEFIGSQREIFSICEKNTDTIYNSRTFCLYEDVEKIKSMGLAKGGSLDNALVVKGKKLLNEGGLRENNEFVKHKILDCMGDFMLSGHRILGTVKCVGGGHNLTTSLLKKFFSDSANWKLVSQKEKDVKSQDYNYSNPIAVNA